MANDDGSRSVSSIPLRKIDTVIDFSFIRDLVADLCCADNGCPAIDPVMFVVQADIHRLPVWHRREAELVHS